MAKDAELASCGPEWIERRMAELRDIHPSLVAHSHRVLGERWPWLCGAELLIKRFRTECFQLEEPEFPFMVGNPEVGMQWPLNECDPGWRHLGPIDVGWVNLCRFGLYAWRNIRRRDRMHHYALCMQLDTREGET